MIKEVTTVLSTGVLNEYGMGTGSFAVSKAFREACSLPQRLVQAVIHSDRYVDESFCKQDFGAGWRYLHRGGEGQGFYDAFRCAHRMEAELLFRDPDITVHIRLYGPDSPDVLYQTKFVIGRRSGVIILAYQ